MISSPPEPLARSRISSANVSYVASAAEKTSSSVMCSGFPPSRRSCRAMCSKLANLVA